MTRGRTSVHVRDRFEFFSNISVLMLVNPQMTLLTFLRCLSRLLYQLQGVGPHPPRRFQWGQPSESQLPLCSPLHHRRTCCVTPALSFSEHSAVCWGVLAFPLTFNTTCLSSKSRRTEPIVLALAGHCSYDCFHVKESFSLPYPAEAH